jgi:hypothetical protein
VRQYAEKNLVVLQWPRAQCTVDGNWLRVWHLHFQEAVDPHISLAGLAKELSEDDFRVSFVQEQAHDVQVHVMTHRRHGESDEVVFANYALLEKINERIGTIETIQEQARDLWLPWRKE